jgi:hypothetical protein
MRAMRALAALAVATALIVPAAAQARAQQKLVIRVYSMLAAAPVVTDHAPKGKANAGDSVAQKSVLFNAAAQFGKKAGLRVGTDSGTTLFTSAKDAEFHGTARLPGGTLTLDGPITYLAKGTSQSIPVTGGTGRFAGAHGSLLVSPGPKATISLNTYTLTLNGLSA